MLVIYKSLEKEINTVFITSVISMNTGSKVQFQILQEEVEVQEEGETGDDTRQFKELVNQLHLRMPSSNNRMDDHGQQRLGLRTIVPKTSFSILVLMNSRR